MREGDLGDLAFSHRLILHMRPRTRPVPSGRRAPPPIRSGGMRSPRPEQASGFGLLGVGTYKTAVSASHAGSKEMAGPHAQVGQGTSTT